MTGKDRLYKSSPEIQFNSITVSIPRWTTRSNLCTGSRYTCFVIEVEAPRDSLPVLSEEIQPPKHWIRRNSANSLPSTSDQTSRIPYRWTLERRYSEFLRFHKQLARLEPDVRRFGFPGKALFNRSKSAIRTRQETLQKYLNQIFTTLQPVPEMVKYFLEVTQNEPMFNNRRDKLQVRSRSLCDSSKHLRSLSCPPKYLRASDFDLIKVLGKGSFGKVFLVRPKWSSYDGSVFAMKVIKKDDVRKRNQSEHTMAERRIMSIIQHPFIVTLYIAFQTSNKLYMLLEYCKGGELFFHLKRMKRFKETWMLFYVGEVALALDYLHRLDILYRDLKPENILLDGDGHVKLTDFGLSKDSVRPNSSNMTFCGTPEYLAPEMITNRNKNVGYTKAVDWWSLGIVAYEMVSGWPPFFDKNFNLMCDKILRKPVRFNPKYHIGLKAQQVIQSLLDRDPTKRLGQQGIESLKQHFFFEGVDWVALEKRQVKPPFRPSTSSPNIDKEFLKMDPRKQTMSPPESINVGDFFPGFSYRQKSLSDS